MLAIVLLVIAIALFGLGALVKGALWLLAVGGIFLVAAIAFGVGQARRRA